MDKIEENKLLSLERTIRNKLKELKEVKPKNHLLDYVTFDEEGDFHCTDEFKKEYRFEALGNETALFFYLKDIKKTLGEKD